MTEHKLQCDCRQWHSELLTDSLQLLCFCHDLRTRIVVIELSAFHGTCGKDARIERATYYHPDTVLEAPIQETALPGGEVCSTDSSKRQRQQMVQSGRVAYGTPRHCKR